MTNKLTLLFILSVAIIAGCSKAKFKPKHELLFQVNTNDIFRGVAFIQRDDVIIWDSSFNIEGNTELQHNFDLINGDYMLVSVVAADGKFHQVETKIFVNNQLMSERQKFCVTGGCGYEWVED